MPNRGKGGRFTKGGAKKSKSRKSSGTTAIVVASAPRSVTRTRTVHVTRRRRGRRGGKSGGGLKPLHVLLGGLAVGYVTGNQGPAAVKSMLDKVPGAKTFGPAGVVAAGALAFNHFKPNKYAKLIGLVSLGVAAYQAGNKGTDLKWVGDADDDAGVADVGADDDNDDIADVGDGDDYEA